jgi:DNA anti-recombination protein RmuC
VPVTARLSRRFYDAFGEEIANELVDWFNAVDLTYRADLRELNELNFARFDAKLEQRIAQSEARMERRLSELDAKIDRVATELDAKIDRVATELDAKIDRVAAELRADLLKWMFLFWLGTVGPILALLWPIATR